MPTSVNPSNIPHDLHHLDKYEAFCALYHIENVEQFVQLYDVYELVSFLPAAPTDAEKEALSSLVGVQNDSGYMDYTRSTNTFELIMQWQEKLQRFDYHALPFSPSKNK